MQKVHVRNIFRLYVPLNCPEGFDIVPQEDPNFGFILRSKKSAANYFYQLELLCLANEENKARTFTNNWATWAKRNPVYFKNNAFTNTVEGITIRIKVNNGMFDFRKLPEQLVRISLNYYADGLFVQQAASSVFELLPKKRQGAVDDEVCVSLDWVSNSDNNNNNNANNTNFNKQISIESPALEEGESSRDDTYNYSPADDYHVGYVAESHSGSSPDSGIVDASYGQQDYGSGQLALFQGQQMSHQSQLQDENYMVLYNGNAEVVGNFRALNFYKSSDINIKEDIRLLVEDKDCRDTLLQIDGVHYKFKKGVHPDTNRRFVGYIAQQVESVVPEAVQLIDGILHVDYESLIPYLSESVRANYNDIQSLNSKAERIQKTIDTMYEEFIKKDRQKTQSTFTPMSVSDRQETKKKFSPMMWRWTLGLLSAFAVLAVVLGVLFFTSNGTGTTPDGHTIEPIDTIPESQLQALRDLYAAAGGRGWRTSNHWLEEGSKPCTWSGVVCDNGVVTELDISTDALIGTLPESIGNLVNLTVLDLRYNSLNGTIPESIAQLRELRGLYLSHNELKGTIPSGLFEQVPHLSVLELGNNELSGTIPSKITNCTSLITLNLSHNKLHGTIPDMPFNAFKALDLSYNQLEGVAPKLNLLTESINVEGNQLSGQPDTLLAFLPFLHTIKIGGNKFNGSLIMNEYQLVTSVKMLNVSYNNFWYFSVMSDTQKVPQFALCDASNIPWKCPLPQWMVSRCRASCVEG